MKKETVNMITKILSVVLLIALIVGILFFFTKRNDNDASKFKREYEELNGTVRQSDGATYNEVEIDSDNPIKYISAKEALDVLKSDSAIIYVGAPWCPWCRNAVPVLFELAKINEVDKIYYIELDDIKSNYEIKDGTLKQTSKGTDDYYALLDALSDHLEDYILKDAEGKEYDTGEKRIYMPYVIAVRNGRIVADKVGTVTLDKDQTKYDKLTAAQHEELASTYGKLFNAALGKKDGECDEDVCS